MHKVLLRFKKYYTPTMILAIYADVYTSVSISLTIFVPCDGCSFNNVVG